VLQASFVYYKLELLFSSEQNSLIVIVVLNRKSVLLGGLTPRARLPFLV